ncbi:hypothetical protein GCM10012288_04030 [Malaciobacter pacificus]|uniref:Peptidase, M75 family n=1 Tax=Malaciobacter pacificus TaxID=1080223 RepID=A0A5C2H4B0_9BACT|nr:imelysin family protein [Malaciobacter pacificus]QEP33781.1 peptidase, M75 family [Malaciobacter pacificus]GGD33297.1 hypothetical protein GCM10012288_04030 [Malaciobacter pacificus]
MKKIFVFMFLNLGILFAQDRAFTSILKNVSIVDVNEAIKNAQNLEKSFSKDDFTKFVQSWKEVETMYFGGDIDENYIDTPRYIDVFHNLKEDLSAQMQRVIESKDEPNIALFKNSFKTINALEYILYNDKEITQREKELAKAVIANIISHLNDIKEVYTNYLNGQQKEEAWENAVVLNTLIASTYKLKEWRIGDPAGFTAKYKNDLDNTRGEYFLSQNSFNAIKAIVNAHEEVVGNKSYYNFASMAKHSDAKNEIKEVHVAIEEIKIALSKIKKDDFKNAQELYKAVSNLHNAYYLSLTTQLSVTAKILDADGD